MISFSKIFDYKKNRSNNNSASSHNIKKIKNKTPKIKQRINILNKKSKSKTKTKNNNSFINNNICFTKYKSQVKLKNYFLKNNLLLNNAHSFNYINYGNTKNSESLNKYSSFYKKINKKQNIAINRFINNKSSKKIVVKKSGIFKRKEINLNNLKNLKNGLKKFLMEKNRKIMNKGIYKKIKKIYMKTNQGNYTTRTRRNSSCSHENIYLNNNYNNYINFNYIDKNYNINILNIQNRQLNIRPNKKSSQKIIYKKINNDLINQRKEKNDLLDLLQLKSKLNNNNNISTLQSKEQISIPELKSKNPINKNNTLSNSSIYNISISTTKDKLYYITEREKLSSYIKNYFKENGHYPKSSLNFYKYGRLLGKGAFGKVNLALHIASGKLVAIKSFNKKKLVTEHSKQKIKTEIDVLKKLKHCKYFTKIYDTFQTGTHIFIIMEFICADLLGFIRKREKLNEKISKVIFKQIIQGLKYMHKLNIVHRDIKLDNLLLDLSNTIKICDFGVSKILKSSDELMYDHCGTPAYLAPEVFGNNGYKGFSCDIWSLGVTLYYMLKGEQPFQGKNLEELKKNIFSKKYNKIEFISEEAEDLIDKMLTKNPEERITLDEIFKHKWIKEVDLCNKNKIKFFSENEKYLLGKYNICYLNDTTEDLIENFDKDDLNTSSETDEKKGNTKSIILAPYNTGISFFGDSYYSIKEIYKEIKIENNICKYKGDAQVSNIKYEMSNNNEFDNGVIKTRKSNTLTSFSSYSDKNKSNNKKSITLSFDDKDKNFLGKKFFCTEIIEDIEKKVGYDRNYLIQCLKDDEVNYATATYYLMLHDKKDKNESL